MPLHVPPVGTAAVPRRGAPVGPLQTPRPPSSEPRRFGNAWHLLALFVVAATIAFGLSGSRLDVELFHAVNAWPRLTGGLFWASLSLLGEGTCLLGLAALLVARHPRALWPLALSAGLLMLTLHPAKDAFDVPRPAAVLGVDSILVVGHRLYKYSFPSGHTATAFMAAHLVMSVLPDRRARLLVLALACLSGLSRIAVGAHWPSDVAAGVGLGWCCAGAGLALAARLRLSCSRIAATVVALLLTVVSLVLTLRMEYQGSESIVRYAIGLSAACLLVPLAWHELRPARDQADQRQR